MITMDIDKLAAALFARQYREEIAISERMEAERALIAAIATEGQFETDSWIIIIDSGNIKLIAK